MKKLLNIFSLLAFLPFAQSCFMEQEDLFENSAMERLEAKKLETFDVLTSAKNGWEMQYFVTGEKGYRGYVLLVKFEKSGQDGVVQFAAKNSLTGNKYIITDGSDPEYPQSYFDVVFDNGPVLTFNSYNNLFHKFSDPNGTGFPGDQGLGTGLGGDYEFVVIEAETKSPDKVVLKGKKRGTYTILKKLPENQDWKDYFTKLDELNDRLYNSNPAPLYMVSGDQTMFLYDGSTSIYSAVDSKSDDKTFAESKKFIQTNSGLRFEETFVFGGKNAGQDFYFNADKSRMESYVEGDPSKGVLAYITGVNPYWFYNKALSANSSNMYTSEWVISEENMGAKFKEKYDAFKASLEADGITGLKLYIGGIVTVGDALQIQAKGVSRTNYWIQLNRVASDETSTVNYANGEQKSKYYDNLASAYTKIDELLACMSSNFKFEVVDVFNMSSVRLVSVDDPENSFVVTYVKK